MATRHKWSQTAKGSTCTKCKTKMVLKPVPAKKIINGNKKVLKPFYSVGGKAPLEQMDSAPACSA